MTSILDSFKLTGRTAVVTGAARGLGQGMALALAEAGSDVVAVDILPAEDTKKQVESLGRKALAVAANLGDRAAIPGVIAYNYFLTRIRTIHTRIDSFTSEFINFLERKVDKG